ncbi:VOC family protein [Cognatilysobacter lacus]|uniref:VOC family protein n=1 Tax=Cognatilysobacter lacus TaxID=1643323 RepID=A0A5D8Z5C2_9GAMM|nr:VOC family protein [Lysobacter lacus]TZF90118.1 VOC family protein [Lysobacter lacus]
MQLVAYLAFDGNCREAFNFYRDALGGDIVYVTTVGESPMCPDAPPEARDRIMHIHLQNGAAALMGADIQLGGGQDTAAGTCVNVMVDTAEEAEAIWAKLAVGADVRMPLAQTFWSARFGMLTDRFGKPWMINCHPAEA